jgi:hypothetical protein
MLCEPEKLSRFQQIPDNVIAPLRLFPMIGLSEGLSGMTPLRRQDVKAA